MEFCGVAAKMWATQNLWYACKINFDFSQKKQNDNKQETVPDKYAQKFWKKSDWKWMFAFALFVLT
jgi:hypothetical protein